MKADFLVIGGGIVGLAVARELKRRRAGASVLLIEKEADFGLHASGRNSGVLHAGFYYREDSLKARFCREGNAALAAYCEAKGLQVNRCGKLVVARSEAELPDLDELLRRGRANGVRLELLAEAEARSIEPRVKTVGRALWSPATATVDPKAVVSAMVEDARREGVELRTGAAYLGRTADAVLTTAGPVSAGFVINAAGLYADRVALDFGFSRAYRILPFKGLYLESDEPPGAVRTCVYPVPDPKTPFLGVHFTVTADGRSKIGPTAVPVLWREQYEGLANFRLSELPGIAARALALLRAEPSYVAIFLDELRKLDRRYMVALASRLLEGVREESFTRWGKPGIRAQLVDLRTGRLVTDFLMEGDARSLHILNAVSPAFTCALPFAREVVDRIDALR